MFDVAGLAEVEMRIAVRKTDDEEELVQTFTLLNTEVDEHQRQLFAAMDGMDTKATVVAGFSAAAVSFLLGHERGVLWRAALITYGIALFAALLALRPRRRTTVRPDALLRLLHDLHVLSALGVIVQAKVDQEPKRETPVPRSTPSRRLRPATPNPAPRSA